MCSITNFTSLDQTIDVTQIIIDCLVVGTSLVFIESTFCGLVLTCQVILHLPHLSFQILFTPLAHCLFIRWITAVDNIVYGNSVHNGLSFEFWTKCPHLNPHPSLCSMTTKQNVACGGLSGRARGDLATSSVELVWLVTAPRPWNVLQLYRQAWWTEGQSQPQTPAQPHGSRCHMAAPEPSAGKET